MQTRGKGVVPDDALMQAAANRLPAPNDNARKSGNLWRIF